jgi:signal transduction histidine kinase
MQSRRSTIRGRLTVFYALVFALCGIALVIVTYLVVRENLRSREREGVTQIVKDDYGYSQQQIDFFNGLHVPPPTTGREANTIGDVLAGVRHDINDEALHTLVVGSSVAVAGMVVVSAIVGWMLAGRALRPVGRLTSRANQLSEANLHERLAMEGPDDELKELADTLDRMLGRLESAFEAQRRFSASVSHELRTPLAVMRAEADLALAAPGADAGEQQLATSVHDASLRAEALLDSLLALSRSESTMQEHTEVDLVELSGDVVSERTQIADAAEVQMGLVLGRAAVEGDPWLLERLVANLVDNAITHNRAGGWLRVEVDAADREAVIRVANTGDPFTDAQVADILEPFHRANGGQRPGHGLGMTIVQSIVKAHAGRLSVTPRVGGGLEVTVALPLVPREAAASDVPSMLAS